MRQHCPACGGQVVSPYGSSHDLLILGEFPGDEEMLQGVPFAVNRRFITAGKVLRTELSLLGMQLADFRVTNIWLHKPNEKDDCYQAGYNHALEEAKGKKAILLVGSDVVKTFTKYKVSDVNGLRVESSVLSAPVIVAMLNPAYALHRAFGEIRFALNRWKYWLEKENLL